MSITKMIVLGGLGYLAYRFFTNLPEMMPQGASGPGQQRGGPQRFAEKSNVTGPGRGVAEDTQDSDGGSTPHVVGRGVVHR